MDSTEDVEQKRGLIQVASIQLGGVTNDGDAEELVQAQNSDKKRKIIKYGIIGLVIVAIILAIVLTLTLGKNKPVPPKPKPPVDYYNPYVIDPKSVQVYPSRTTGIIKVPVDYDPEHHSYVFKRLLSKMRGKAANSTFGVNSSAIPTGANNKLIRTLNFTFTQNTWRVSKLTIRDNGTERYSIPNAALGNPGENRDMRLEMVGFKMASKGTFDFQFNDPLTNGNQFLNTTNCSLVFMDKFIQMDFNLPSQNLYGFGERIHEFGLKEGAWNMWAHGQPNPYDDGQSGRKGGYGVHPFILVQGKNKDDFIGIYFRNSNAMTPIITFYDNPVDGSKTSKLSYITTGGQLEIYFFIHGSAMDIIKKYQDVMGAKPKLPPFWSLGWMQASYKWSTQEQVENVVAQYKANDFPLDTVFLDIPYMANYVDFTVNTTAFKNLSDFATTLHANKQQIIPIIDAGISAEDTSNTYYAMGNSDDIFIKSGLYNSTKYNNNLVNQVWPKIAVFVDWFNEKSTKMWFRGLQDLFEQFHYDGIWIDMNEPWGFQTAEMDPANPVPIPIDGGAEKNCRRPRYLEQETSSPKQNDFQWYKSFTQDKNSTWYLPFLPDFENYQSYDNNSISLNATNPSINQTQYNVHSFYGHMMARRTQEYFDMVGRNKADPRFDKRNFILTRSTFTSSGQYASHWLGDNYREYRYMNYSISGTMNMNMFGIPHVGADIGGFFGASINPQLMAKWAQLGTFYPFARFHYDIHSPENEPYIQSEPYRSIIRRTMLDRYQYSRQLYTCLFDMSNNGGSCFSPLFYTFPNDTNLYQNYESSFIFANSIKVSPNLLEDTQSIPAYFPHAHGKWVSLVNTREILAGNTTYQLDTTGFSTPAHMMPGKVIAFQNNSDGTIMNIHQLINGSITVLVNPDDNDFAQGNIFLDQGESLYELNERQYEYYAIQFSQKSIQFLVPDGNPGTQMGYSMESIKILNGERFKDNDIACYLDSQTLIPQPLVSRWIEEEAVLKIFNEKGDALRFSQIHSIHFGNDQEFNICDQKHYQYKTQDGKEPNLFNQSSVSIDLVHGPGFLPEVTVQLSIHRGNIINLGWTYKFDQSRTGKKMFKIPDEYVSANQIPLEGDLSEFVQIRASPFQVKFLYQDKDQTEFFGIDSLVYDDYLNWVKMHVITEKANNFRGIFGLGERASDEFFFKDGVYSMWTKDIPTPIESGKFPAANMYGVHPYFMFKHKIGSWVGILYNLAAAQDWWIKNDQDNGQVNIQTVAVGGRVDLYIIMGSTPDQVQSKYLQLIGKPVLIPQWGLGWNQCRYGYRNLNVLKSVLAGYRNNGIPLDVMWSDIDYMKDYRNFIYDDEIAYKGLPDFINSLHQQGMRYVPLIDAGTAARPLPQDNYTQYQDGVKKDVFLKIQGEIFIGQVWPNDAAFPDFLDSTAIKWWQDNLDSMHKLLPFDGLWLDMNEFSNFCNGVCYQKQAPAKSIKSNLKYTPTGKDLEQQNTVPLDAQHKNGEYQLDTHSITGISEIKVTHEWFTNSLKTRTFIIERSSSVGLGKWASRWLGDNFSDQKFMKLSVSGIMLMNMFGIPLVGADICGFLGDTNQDLCTKWHYVGAFYPFSRNHNGGNVAQEPYVWDKQSMKAMTEAIKIKYALVRYYYTELFALSTQDGEGTFFKPMFFEFPEDYNTTTDIDYNVMLGSALKLSINSGNMSASAQEMDFYFPQGTWCRLMGNTNGETCFISGTNGLVKNYPSGLTDFQLHLREGFIVPLQDTMSQQAKPFNTTKDLQSQPVDFHILGAVNDTNTGQWISSGRYINDDGLSLNITGNYNSYNIKADFDGKDNITMNFERRESATLHLVPETGCYLVNQNDLLGALYFYNAESLKLMDSFKMTIEYRDGKTSKFNGSYDSINDRLVFDLLSAHVCMSIIHEISIVRSK